VGGSGTISAGAVWFDAATGADLGREELMYNSLRHAGPYGKANGLGDVESLCAAPTPTPTASPTASATPTATRTPTASPSASVTPSPGVTPPPTASATPTPRPRRWTIYLPTADREAKCVELERHADVVLVFDRSTSMLRPAGDGTLPKNTASIRAGEAFVRLLALQPAPGSGSDRAAIVGFNDTAWTEQGLTGDLAELQGALASLSARTAEGTRIDLALDEGQRALEGPARRPEVQAVLILLTDGLPNRVPTPVSGGSQEDTVLERATAAKAKGTRIYAVALGEADDVLRPLLERTATSPDMYFHAPSGEDLEAIYRQIAGSIVRCPGER
jgi:hypothetical protein